MPVVYFSYLLKCDEISYEKFTLKHSEEDTNLFVIFK
jgi:hypothetical protein